MKKIKTLGLAIGLIASINVSHAQTIPMEHHGLFGFHPFRGLMRKAEMGAVAGVAGYGAYRYNQAGRSVIEQNAEPALQYYGTVSGETYLNNIREDLEHHKILGKHNLLVAFANIVAQEPQYHSNAVNILNSLTIETTDFDKRVEEQKLLTYTPGLSKTRTGSLDKSCHNIDFVEDRDGPGIAHGGHFLPYVTAETGWLRGTQSNLGIIPKQVADALRGHLYRNFDTFRRDIWKTIGNDRVLNDVFSERNIEEMKKVMLHLSYKNRQQIKVKKYNIHHKCPIHDGGGVYDFDNLVIVSPAIHDILLNSKYHLGIE